MPSEIPPTADDLTERVAVAICEAYGDEWADLHESGVGLGPADNPARDDFRDMARAAIAAARDIKTTERQETFRDAADMLIAVRPQDIRLAFGEMSAQEMRAVMAVLRWQSQKMMNKAIA
jgi:hypothetical protein